MTQRVTWPAVERLAPRLAPRDWSILEKVRDAGILTGSQLTRLCFADLSPSTQDRTRRRVMARLHQLHAVTRLDRVIGGVRAGSSGWVYRLGPAGQRLLQLRAGQRGDHRIRKAWTPGTLFLQHALDVAELYVQLSEASSPAVRLTTFQTEPACWWRDGLGGHLKPDALTVLSTAAYDELVWLEVDRGTESLPTLRRKLLSYQSFVQRGQLGPSGVLPHVVISTPNDQRHREVAALVHQLPDTNIFTVARFEIATTAILALATNTVEEPP